MLSKNNIIAIDCGHTKDRGSCDYGAVGVRPESDLTREVGNLVISKLQTLGYKTINCTANTAGSLDSSLAYRVNTATNAGAAFFASIHFNCFNGQAHGTEVFTYGGKVYPEAQSVLSNLVALGFTNRGIKDGSELYVISNTNCEAMLIEVCFCDNQSDMSKYNAENVANAIVKGLVGSTTNSTTRPVTPSNPTTPYNSSIPTGENIVNFFKDCGYVEKTKDGRVIFHYDRHNYLAIGKGLCTITYDDGKGRKGCKSLI